jgi:hypothetical protein
MSILLKLYLVFFRTFLDSPDKVNVTRMKAFKYTGLRRSGKTETVISLHTDLTKQVIPFQNSDMRGFE